MAEWLTWCQTTGTANSISTLWEGTVAGLVLDTLDNMLSKNERKLLGKLSPIFMALLNEENMAFTFTYLMGFKPV